MTPKYISIATSPRWIYFIFLVVLAYRELGLPYLALFNAAFVAISLLVLSKPIIKPDDSEDDYLFGSDRVRVNRYITLVLTILVTIINLFFAIEDGNAKITFIFIISLLQSGLILASAAILKYKLSAHVAYWGVICMYLFDGSAKYIALLLGSSIIGWSRVELRKHTYLQVFIAFAVNVVAYIVTDLLNVWPI